MVVAPESDERDGDGLVGRVLCGKWAIERRIGSGGMATVYAAAHRKNQRRVAVKVLHPRLALCPRARRRFLREGLVANRVDHPHAVSVLDEDIDGDTLFLVMELLEGETLDALWRRSGRRVPAAQALSIADAILDVLASAHARGVVHRDLKPANVFLTTRGEVKVLDFGIASLRETSADAVTQGDSVLGTPAFMAPEQARARWAEVDTRTDVWAVGALLFTVLCGRTVYDGDTGQEVLIACATQPPPSLVTFLPGAPAGVVALVDRALAVDRADRWRDASAMQDALRSLLSGAAAGASAWGPAPAPRRTAGVTLDESMSTDLDLPAHASRERARARAGLRTWTGVALAAALLAALAIPSRGATGSRRSAPRGAAPVGASAPVQPAVSAPAARARDLEPGGSASDPEAAPPRPSPRESTPAPRALPSRREATPVAEPRAAPTPHGPSPQASASAEDLLDPRLDYR